MPKPRLFDWLGAPAPGNDFGLLEAVVGLVGGFVLASLAAGAYLAASHHPGATTSFGADLFSLTGLWVGMVGAAIGAVWLHPSALLAPSESPAAGRPAAISTARAGVDAGSGSTEAAGDEVRSASGSTWRQLAACYGLRFRPLDLPLGIAVGVGAEYGLVPLFELPLSPFVHNLSQQIGKPAEQLTGGVYGAGFVVLAIFVCVGSPFVEELFFRGLLMRAILGRAAPLGRRLAPTVAIVVTALLFALAHFEAIQFLALAGFGGVLGLLAWRSGRLGPGMIAHCSFNATAIIAIARQH